MNRVGTAAVALLLTTNLSTGQEAPTGATPRPPAHPRQLRFADSDWTPPRAGEARVALAGGATAFLVSDHTLPLVDIVVVARAGAFLDPVDLRGVSDLTATLLRRGGTLELEPDLFDQRADELGAVLTSQATMLYGAASLRCTSDLLPQAVELFFDMIEHPRFAPDRVAGIKRNLAEGLGRRNLDALRVLAREWDWLQFGENHFSTRPMRAQDLDRLTPEVLAEFHRRHWQPGDLKLAVAGDIEEEQLRSLVDPRLEAWSSAVDSSASSAWPPPGPKSSGQAGLFHLAADIPQAKVAVGHRAPPDLPSVEERIRLEVLAEILGGGGAISRLNGRLRSAEGLVYRASARLDPGDLWPADYQLFFDTLDRNTPRALEALLEEVDRMLSTTPHPEELAIVKRELIARRLRDFDTAEEAAGYLVEDALVGRDEAYRSEYSRILDAVTVNDVLETARRHLRRDALTVLVVGRWPELAGPVDSQGVTRLERLVGQRVVHLPVRDALSLEPLPSG